MNEIEEIKVLMQQKSGKKLAAFSIFIFLIIIMIIFWGTYEYCRNIHLKQMDDYLKYIPEHIESQKNVELMRTGVYEEDILTRADLGLMLYREENELSEAELLEKIRSTVSAASVSILDGKRAILSTTGPVSPEENFLAAIQSLEPRLPRLELYPELSENGEETGKNDGKGFVLLPIPENTNRSLLFEFFCDSILEIQNTFDDWYDILVRSLFTDNSAAFSKRGDKLTSYSMDGLSHEENAQLNKELTDVFQNKEKFRSRWNGTPGQLITILGNRYLAVMVHYQQDDTDILLTEPIKQVIRTGFFIAASISAIIGLGIILLQRYVFRVLIHEKEGEEAAGDSRKYMWDKTLPGLLIMLAVTIIFSTMLLLLEKRTNISSTAIFNPEYIKGEINWRNDQEKTISSAFSEFYRSRTRLLADFLIMNPSHQTRAGLEELSRIAGTDYLMLFDSTGQEILSSNSYTDFSVGKNLSEDYRAVLLGYPDAVVGPEADPYTGKMQIGTAVLMTNGERQPNGFLLGVYSAGDLSATLKNLSYENTVSLYTTPKGHIVAAVNDADGTFIAHTDPQMIGLKAADYFEDYEPDSSYEGFSDYDGESAYISANSAGGKTLLYILPERGGSYIQTNTVLAATAVLLILVLIYYPNAGVLIKQAIAEAGEKLQPSDNIRNPLLIFPDGYETFLTLFVIFTIIASANRWWTTFDYVFGRKWSKGVHLFSVWEVIFVLAATLTCEYLMRTVLNLLESRLSLRAKTITKVLKSLIFYALSIFLFFFILDTFGTNTSAMLASAGVVSIAVGLGAKSMAEDILAGFFTMMEGSIRVGDIVTVQFDKSSKITGTVTNMGIRTTEITDGDGNVLLLNNSKVSSVYNQSRKHEQEEND